MIKYVDVIIGFREIPDEATLCINISNCQNHCKGCHSPYLVKDIGNELTKESLAELIRKNDGITCVSFMGEGNDQDALIELARFIKENYDLKVGLYSGRESVDEEIIWDAFDYVKVGPYIKELGPINEITTNQRLYLAKNKEDITYKFWKKN